MIFVGEVLRQGAEAVSDDEPARPSVFRVIEIFHGLEPGTTEVEIWSGNLHNLLPESRWAIDAVRSIDGTINDRFCGRSARLDETDPEDRRWGEAFLKQLTERRDGIAPTTVRIHPFTSPLTEFGNIGTITVLLKNETQTLQFSVSDDTLFERSIEPGEYDVEVAGAPLPFLGLRQGRFNAQPSSCNSLSLEFGRKTRLSGTVTLPDGSPAAGATVMIEPYPPGDHRGETMPTNPEGHYEFRGMAAGEYAVSVTKHGFRDTFYPASTTGSSAGAVTVSESGEVTDIDIQVAGKLPLAEVTLVIAAVDGSAAVSVPASVHVEKLFEGRTTSMTIYGKTDYRGRFPVETKVGALVEVRASVGPAAEIASHSSEPLETGGLSFPVLETDQIEHLSLSERLCKVSVIRWEPCTEDDASSEAQGPPVNDPEGR